MLRKVVYPMSTWMNGKSNLNMEYNTDADYMHAKRVCKDFKIKHLGEYHDLYLKRYALRLADVLKSSEKYI